jgi:hypothetical protein
MPFDLQLKLEAIHIRITRSQTLGSSCQRGNRNPPACAGGSALGLHGCTPNSFLCSNIALLCIPDALLYTKNGIFCTKIGVCCTKLALFCTNRPALCIPNPSLCTKIDVFCTKIAVLCTPNPSVCTKTGLFCIPNRCFYKEIALLSTLNAMRLITKLLCLIPKPLPLIRIVRTTCGSGWLNAVTCGSRRMPYFVRSSATRLFTGLPKYFRSIRSF